MAIQCSSRMNQTMVIGLLSQQIRILHKTNKKKKIVNCWPSGKYVNLLYMYSILGRDSFCFNFCLNSAWQRSVCGTAEVVWKPSFLWQWPSVHLHFFGLLFLIFLLTIPHRFSMAVKYTNIMVIYPTLGAFGSVGRSQILLEDEINIFKKLVSRRKHEVL